jgi:hypothetical protein
MLRRGRHRRRRPGQPFFLASALLLAASVVAATSGGSPSALSRLGLEATDRFANPLPGDRGLAGSSPVLNDLGPRLEAPTPLLVSSQPPLDSGPPVRIQIPRLGVDSRLIPLGLNPDGTLEVPTDYAEAGWWDGGTIPGDVGPSVIVGHVDSTNGPAVFYAVRDLRAGDQVLVWRRDGSLFRFRVDSVEEFSKGAFPTDRVYGPFRFAGLRLITCGGAFDTSTHHYLDNIVVFAHSA